MRQRMHKSEAEIALIRRRRHSVADVGGYAIRDAVKVGAFAKSTSPWPAVTRWSLRSRKRFPDAEYRDTWVWFQSGLNTDGAHNPVTARRVLERGDILSPEHLPDDQRPITPRWNARCLSGEVDAASLKIWEANVAAHEYGMSLLKPGVKLRRHHP